MEIVKSLTCKEMVGFLGILGEDSIVALDTEGTNINLDYRDGTGYGIGISITFRLHGDLMGGYYPFRHVNSLIEQDSNLEPEDQYSLRQAITNFKGWLVFHNAKHDLVALHTLGVDYKGKFYDTLLMCHLLNETYPYSKSLNACVAHYVSEDYAKDDAILNTFLVGMEWHEIPVFVMAPYAIHDAMLTLLLFEAVEPRLFKEMPREYWDHKQAYVRTVIKMESRGICVDTELCESMSAVGTAIMAEVVEELGLNPGSPIDQRELFLNRLQLPVLKRSEKTDNPSFNKEVMEEYDRILENRPTSDRTAASVLNFRGWQKAVSSNYKPYVTLLSPDGRLRPNYKLHGTKTGRSSCEKPNLQQIPRISEKAWNGKLKQAFIPEEGYTLWEADYSQLEFRLGAAYAQEKILIDIFADPTRDVFTEMAELENWPRQNIKTRTYTIQFGGGATRLSNVFGVTMIEGARIRDTFFANYPGFDKVIKLATRKARSKGQLQLWSGRYRHFQWPANEAHKGFNSVIQGGAADIFNHQMVRLDAEVDNEKECRMLLMVHDSVVFEVKNGTEDHYLPLIKKVMEDVKPDFGVVFRVDLHKWGEE